MKINAKGQLTIPIKLRGQLGFLPGAKVVIEVKNGEVLIIRKATESRNGRGRGIVAHLRGRLSKAPVSKESGQ